MQAVLRNLVFKKAGIPASLEIAKVKEIPAEGGAVLYLDSFDQVRMVDNTLRAIEETRTVPGRVPRERAPPERLEGSGGGASWGHPRRSPRCGHRAECLVHGESAKAWHEDSGRITFECCEELAFPPSLCDALAQAIKRDLGEISPLIPGKLTDRSMEWQLMAQLRGAAAKLRSPAEAEAAAEIIAPLAQEILEDPQGHLRKMPGALQRHRGSAHGAR